MCGLKLIVNDRCIKDVVVKRANNASLLNAVCAYVQQILSCVDIGDGRLTGVLWYFQHK